MKITQIDTIPYSVPYRKPARFASGVVDRANNVLVRVWTDAGLVGEAEAQPRPYTYGDTQASIVATIRDHLAPALVGMDPLATELVYERGAMLAGNQVARAAVDVAVWDVTGKALGQPCGTLLGGYATSVEVAHMVGFAEPAAMAAEALEVSERYGVRTFKVKVGREVKLDISACRAIREALPEARLYVDANRGWSYDHACRAAEHLVELGVVGIEEPLSLDDRRGRRRLAERWRIPLIGDESCISLGHTAQELVEGAAGMVSIKAARTGFTESRRILHLCLGHGVPAIVGSQYEGGVGVLATAAFAAAFAETARSAAELVNVFDLEDDLLAMPIAIRDGRIAVPDTAGLGIEIDEEKLALYRVDGKRTLTHV